MYTVCLTIDMFKYICTNAHVCASLLNLRSQFVERHSINHPIHNHIEVHIDLWNISFMKVKCTIVYLCFTTKRMKLLWLKPCCKTEILTSDTYACFSYLFPCHRRGRNKNNIAMDIYFNHVSTNHICIYNSELQHSDKLQPPWNSCNFSNKTNLKLWSTPITSEKELRLADSEPTLALSV